MDRGASPERSYALRGGEMRETRPRRGCPSAADPPDLKVLQGAAVRRRPWEQELLAFMR